MKAITLLLLASFLSTEPFAAADASPAVATATTVAAGSSHEAIFGASKRRKRKKSRPAYRRIGRYLAPTAQQATA
ncbi:hypothetical protein [Hymenobacter lucidus]|uniref:Uncharacterized protein n=1 Tax=Hymenobacter lucidus TaxID=2880930 RepID=A0ABS8ASR1_9BACT|nr:hypothetical protein [Hymenobacter lucidus]MCB2409252.1 hypothetical protein [Hymenobacter lucidus]